MGKVYGIIATLDQSLHPHQKLLYGSEGWTLRKKDKDLLFLTYVKRRSQILEYFIIPCYFIIVFFL